MTAIAKRDVTELETYSGKYIDFLDPQPEDIELVDIANGLANTCRFGGQVYRFYSVAEHSIRVAEQLPEHLRLAGLLHDAHEAYTGDIIAPMKRAIQRRAPGLIAEMSNKLDAAIGAKLGVEPYLMHSAEVKMADDYVMFQEAAALKYSHGIGAHWGNEHYYVPLGGIGWSPAKAERMFLQAYERFQWLTN